MFEVLPFVPEDADLLRPQAQQAMEMSEIGHWRTMVRVAAQQGPAWTGWWRGDIVGVGGFALRWPGRASAWCVLAGGVPRPAWLGLHRAVQARVAQAVAELGLVRIEAECMRGFAAGDRWLRLLGFELEGVARRYGPVDGDRGGQDYGRYAWVLT